MRFFHTIWVAECIGDHRGIIVERDASTKRIESIQLLLSVRGRGRRLFLEDYSHALVEARPEYWLRLGYIRGLRWGLWRGVQAASGERVEVKRCPTRFYRVP